MRKYLLSTLSVIFLLCCSTSLYAQTMANLALTATENHSGGGQTAFNYGPDEYNDGVISNCGSTPWGWVSTNGWIEYRWASPQLVGKVLFYKDNRPMTQCVVEYWDGSSYQTIMNYNSTQTCLDSISFPTVTTTRLRFNNVGGSSNPNHREIEVYSGIIPCTGVPTTFIEGPNEVCYNRPFTLTLNGLQITSNLTFQWQYSDNNGSSWSNFIGTPAPLGGAIIDSIKDTRWYRCLVTCTNSNQSYQTPVYRVDVAEFYHCYCLTKVSSTAGNDIGNMTIVSNQSGDTVYNNGSVTKLLDNDAATRVYTDYTYSVAPNCLYRDSSYRLSVLQFSSASSFKGGYLTAYLDLNRDGIYDTATERIVVEQVTGTNNPAQWVLANFTIPSNAQVGLTGLRVILSDNPALVACEDHSGEGEVEDYVVDICYRPCDGPTNAGITQATDSSMCVSYEYTVLDTTYEQQRSGFERAWQVSADNINWFHVNNSGNKDTINRTFTGQPLYYRIRVVCPVTDDTTYSQPTFVNAKPGYKCYCYSKAIGGNMEDTSDIGSITIGAYSVGTGGAHIKNPLAYRSRTDHTDNDPLIFYTDSAYSFHVFHTLKTEEHGDSKITVFVDFNNNNQYDLPEERIYTGFTSVGNHTLIDQMNIPYNVITDVPTGMRFILNNNVGPNVPSDDACGGYTSGETEDFIVVFRRKFPTSVNGFGTVNNFSLYPNPTTGMFNVRLDAMPKSHNTDIQISVTTITGKQVLSINETYDGGVYNKEIDMNGYSSGVYLVKVSIDGSEMVRKLIVE